MNRNYQKELEKIIEENQKQGKIPRLFFAQLLCALQQLCVGISVPVF